MTTQSSPAPARRRDPRRTVSEAKIATIMGSAAGFGAVVGLVLLNPVGTSAATGATAATGPAAQTTQAAPAAPQQAAQTPASDFFSPPPGFTDQPPIVGQGFGSQGSSGGQGLSSSQGGFGGTQGLSGGQGGFGNQGGFGGQVPGMRSGGS